MIISGYTNKFNHLGPEQIRTNSVSVSEALISQPLYMTYYLLPSSWLTCTMWLIVFSKHGYSNPPSIEYSYVNLTLASPRDGVYVLFTWMSAGLLWWQTWYYMTYKVVQDNTASSWISRVTHFSNPAIMQGRSPRSLQKRTRTPKPHQLAPYESSAKWLLCPQLSHLSVAQTWAVPTGPCPICRFMSRETNAI